MNDDFIAKINGTEKKKGAPNLFKMALG